MSEMVGADAWLACPLDSCPPSRSCLFGCEVARERRNLMQRGWSSADPRPPAEIETFAHCTCPPRRNDPFCPAHCPPGHPVLSRWREAPIGTRLAWEFDLNWVSFDRPDMLFWQHDRYTMWPLPGLDPERFGFYDRLVPSWKEA